MWSQARLTLYIIAAFGMAGSLIALLGFGTFDKETWMLDIHPIDVRWLGGQVAGVIAPVVAAVALKLGWGKKP
jgi:hypothetical protein